MWLFVRGTENVEVHSSVNVPAHPGSYFFGSSDIERKHKHAHTNTHN